MTLRFQLNDERTRFFIQDNEISSVRNIAKAYDSLPENFRTEKDKFISERKCLKDFFDEKFVFTINAPELTNLDVFDIFIYGGLAHANRDKKQTFDLWMREPLSESLLKNRFITILSEFMDVIKRVQKLNTDVIAMLYLSRS